MSAPAHCVATSPATPIHLEKEMTISLSSERSRPAVSFVRPFAALLRMVVTLRANHARRTALKTMLEFDAEQFRDLGICREDVRQALHNPALAGRKLTMARHETSHHELNK
jgi:uncharacterized protein YjiS (DUF1127 family)